MKQPSKEKAPQAGRAASEALSNQHSRDCIDLRTEGKEPRIDSRLLAQRLGVKHKNTIELLQKHKTAFLELGKVPFQTEALPGSRTGQKERFALLNEDQAYFLLSLSRNTARVVRLKLDLVKAFAQARKAVAVRELEYLPAYHDLHNAIARAAGDSPNAKWVHANANRAINAAAGIQAGQRKQAGPCEQSLLVLASAAAARAAREARTARDVQPAIKAALLPLSQLQIAQGAA